MKTRTYVLSLIFVLAIMVIGGSCATKKKAISDEDFYKAYTGTWINTDYKIQKRINHPDGTRDNFYNVSNPMPAAKKKITILKQWSDSKGIIWYRGHVEGILIIFSKRYEMGKISNSGNTWEFLWASEDFPIEEWEPDRFEYNYYIYYRQE